MRQLYCSLGALSAVCFLSCCAVVVMESVLCGMRFKRKKQEWSKYLSELPLQHGETLIEISCQSCTLTCVYNGAVKEQWSRNNDRVVGRDLNIN